MVTAMMSVMLVEFLVEFFSGPYDISYIFSSAFCCGDGLRNHNNHADRPSHSPHNEPLCVAEVEAVHDGLNDG